MSNLLFLHAVENAFYVLRGIARSKWVAGEITETQFRKRVDALDRAAQKRSVHYGYVWIWN